MGDESLKYHITLIQTEDDYDNPWSHSEQLFWHAANASLPNGISYDEAGEREERSKSI
jgi:abhydrolase domain-containing protein 12